MVLDELSLAVGTSRAAGLSPGAFGAAADGERDVGSDARAHSRCGTGCVHCCAQGAEGKEKPGGAACVLTARSEVSLRGEVGAERFRAALCLAGCRFVPGRRGFVAAQGRTLLCPQAEGKRLSGLSVKPLGCGVVCNNASKAKSSACAFSLEKSVSVPFLRVGWAGEFRRSV